ncbi:unnamed protein product [Rangifer tarandus platyrhynchus]|uniref:Uncharacterized protein n=1 Tax=Rangifer tarandus platyrhynchus TaxID=3082113 RepID=A0AC59Z1R1_RANTA
MGNGGNTDLRGSRSPRLQLTAKEGGSSGLRSGCLRRLQEQRHSFGPAFQTRDWCIHLQESTSSRDGPRG